MSRMMNRCVIAIVAPAALLFSAACVHAEPTGKELLEQSAKAIQATGVMKFSVHAGLEGSPGITMGGDGKVTIIRGAASPGGTSLAIEGTLAAPDGAIKVSMAALENRTLQYIDELGKRVVERYIMPAPDVEKNFSRPRNYLLPPPLMDGDPYLSDYKAREFRIEPDQDVRGEKCWVIRCVLDPAHTERMVMVSKKDMLPRRYEQVRIDGQARRARVWELFDVQTGMKLTPKDLELAIPPGYTKFKDETKPQEPSATPPTMPTQPPQPAIPPGGPSKGADAAGFTLPKVDGSGNVSLGALKGQVVVAGFWGPMFEQSKTLGKSLQATADAYKGKPVSVLGIACRDATAAQAMALWKDAGLSIDCVLNGDNTAGLYNVRGFPSICIIDANGKVAAFFEGNVSQQALKAAIDAAMGPPKN